MDPLSLTASILAITTACIKTAHLLDGLREKYKHAQITISALCAEATVISASLSQIQSFILRNPGAIITQLRPRSEVIATFDSALTSCSVVFAVLDDEIATLVMEGHEDDMSWSQRAKLVWKDGVMKDLLLQLRGQSAAIGLLIQALQLESISSIKEMLQQNSNLLDSVMRRTRSLRDTHPKVIAPRSIFDNRLNFGSMIDTEHTGLSESTFAFDDLLVDSKVYRRVLAQARSKVSLQGEKEENHEQNKEEAGNSAKEARIAWDHSLRLFYSALCNDPVLAEIIDTVERDEDFKEEYIAVKAWFSLLSMDERKTTLYHFAKASIDMDLQKPDDEHTTFVPDTYKLPSPNNERYGWI